jgi:hypothetical protein
MTAGERQAPAQSGNIELQYIRRYFNIAQKSRLRRLAWCSGNNVMIEIVQFALIDAERIALFHV